jgi:SWI/SNF-related matrix-associated actin-dependent regulator 1 of chromatin subfamily A
MEVYTAVHLINPQLFPSAYQFGMKYCGPKMNRFTAGMDFNGASNTEELHSILRKHMMVRRLKQDVLKDLPPKTRSLVPIEISNRKEYELLKLGVIEALDAAGNVTKQQKKMHQLALIEKLKQCAIKGKLESAIGWIREFLDDEENKLVVMATHHATIDAVQAAFPDMSVVVDGRTAAGARQEAVDAFQKNPATRLFIGNIKAAGVGLTLTAASSVVFLEFPWTPGELTQAEDRIHRIGQVENCTIHMLAGEATIDVDICEVLAKKAKIMAQVLDGATEEDTGVLDELIARLRGE